MKKRNRLRGAMATYGITIKELSDVLGVSAVTSSTKINGKVDFTSSEMAKILKFFNEKGESYTAENLFDLTS